MGQIESVELKEFVRQTISEIEQGIEIGKRSLKGTIKFKVSIARTEKIGGDVKLYVVKGGGGTERQEISNIEFEVYPHYPENKSPYKVTTAELDEPPY